MGKKENPIKITNATNSIIDIGTNTVDIVYHKKSIKSLIKNLIKK